MTWKETLQLKGQLEAEIKARSMIYQIGDKEEAARAFRRPLDHFYHWPYSRWSRVRRAFVRKQNRVMNECVARGIPHDLPFNRFPHYRQMMGLE